MTPTEAAFLGLLQGLTEFLPVSSSGHLVLGQALFGLDLPGVRFEVTVHVATLLAVLAVYRQRISWLLKGSLSGDREAIVYVGLLIVASVPAAVAGILARPYFEGAFERPMVAAALLLLSGLFAWSIDRSAQLQALRDGADAPGVRERPDLLGAIAIGVAQALAILPGVSRSGSTVAVGARTGVDVVCMAEFSFLLSVPAIAGAAVLQLAGSAVMWNSSGGAALATGFLVAMVSGVAAIRLFVRMLEKHHFVWFAYYCWLAGGSYLVAALAIPELR